MLKTTDSDSDSKAVARPTRVLSSAHPSHPVAGLVLLRFLFKIRADLPAITPGTSPLQAFLAFQNSETSWALASVTKPIPETRTMFLGEGKGAERPQRPPAREVPLMYSLQYDVYGYSVFYTVSSVKIP